MTDSYKNKYCPCCGFNTKDPSERFEYSICPICYWEDDQIQFYDPELSDGANRVSLVQAQLNFEEFGACERDMIKNTRKPTHKDKRNPGWEIAQYVDFNFRQEIVNFVLGHNTINDLPRIALIGINEGLECDSLIILAGLSDADNSFEIEQYFNRTISELNMVLPDKRTASIELAVLYADLVINRKLDPILGVNKIIRRCFDLCDFGEDMKYAMDNIGFEAVYALYWTFDDLRNADRSWDENKSNSQLMTETKEEIICELIKWRKSGSISNQPSL